MPVSRRLTSISKLKTKRKKALIGIQVRWLSSALIVPRAHSGPLCKILFCREHLHIQAYFCYQVFNDLCTKPGDLFQPCHRIIIRCKKILDSFRQFVYKLLCLLYVFLYQLKQVLLVVCSSASAIPLKEACISTHCQPCLSCVPVHT